MYDRDFDKLDPKLESSKKKDNHYSWLGSWIENKRECKKLPATFKNSNNKFFLWNIEKFSTYFNKTVYEINGLG